MLDKAIALAATAFTGKFDKGGNPYILHLLHVMNAVSSYGEDVMIIGVLHDLLEDTDYTAKELYDMGFNHRIVVGIEAMTHPRGEPYDDYIRRVATNPDSRKVKLEDLKHNSDITRMKGLREKDFKRLEKYHRAFEYLKD